MTAPGKDQISYMSCSSSICVMTDTRLVRIKTSQQGRTRRAASRAIVHLCKEYTVGAQFVDIGGLDFRSEATDVGEAKIIGHYQHHVGAFRCRPTRPTSAPLLVLGRVLMMIHDALNAADLLRW